MSTGRRQSPTSARQLRKELVRLRLELHRQELRHESRHLMQPLHQARELGQTWQRALGMRHATLWALAGVTLLGFLGGKGSRPLSRGLRRARPYLPLLAAALRLLVAWRQRPASTDAPPSPPEP